MRTSWPVGVEMEGWMDPASTQRSIDMENRVADRVAARSFTTWDPRWQPLVLALQGIRLAFHDLSSLLKPPIEPWPWTAIPFLLVHPQNVDFYLVAILHSIYQSVEPNKFPERMLYFVGFYNSLVRKVKDSRACEFVIGYRLLKPMIVYVAMEILLTIEAW